MADLQIRVRVEDEGELGAALDLMTERPDIHVETVSTVTEPKLKPQVEPITALLIGAGVLAVAKFVIDWWDRVRGGLVIDQRPDVRDMIYRDRDVPFGWVLVFPPDGGSVKVDVKDAPKDAVENWISEVISGVFGSISEVAKAAGDALGAENVEVRPVAA